MPVRTKNLNARARTRAHQMKMQSRPEAQITPELGQETPLIIQKALQAPRDIMASNLVWDSWAHEAAGYFILAPVRKRIQSLARRSRRCNEPEAAFEKKYSQLVREQFRKAAKDPCSKRAVALYNQTSRRLRVAFSQTLKQAGTPRAENFYADLTRRKLEAIGSLRSVFSVLFNGEAQHLDAKNLLGAIASLQAQRQGPKTPDWTDRLKKKIILAYVGLVKKGHRPKVPQVARIVFSEYSKPTSTEWDKDHLCEQVRNVLRPLGLVR